MSRWNKGQTWDFWVLQRQEPLHIWRNFTTWVRKSNEIWNSVIDNICPLKGSSATNVWWRTRLGQKKNLSTRGNSCQRCIIFSVVSAMLWSLYTLSFHCFDFNELNKIKRINNKENEVISKWCSRMVVVKCRLSAWGRGMAGEGDTFHLIHFIAGGHGRQIYHWSCNS